MIDSVDSVLVFWTSNAMVSGFVNQEIGYSYKLKPVIVLRDPSAPTTGFTYGFDTIEMGPDRAREDTEKLRSYLLRQKAGKENAETVALVVSGIVVVGLLLGLGLPMLKPEGR